MKTRSLVLIAVITFLFSTGDSTAMAQWAGVTLPKSYPQLTKPAGIDLDVTYISRTPLYKRYQVAYTADGRPYLEPGTENHKRWPSQGEVITFTAHIMNKGTTASGNFTFKWFIDGTQMAAGTHNSLSPNQEGTESYQWVWAHTLSGERLLGMHTVKFIVDPTNAISETYESNNFIQDRTDAISLYLAVTPELYQALETPVDPKWPFSAEDWLQKQIAAMNAAFARSIYPSIPNGVTERVRLDRIFITSSPPDAGFDIDGGFFMGNDDRQGNNYYDPVNDISGALIHELTHQLGIIDMYNLDVSLEIPQVLDRFGQPVQMEFSSASLFQGIMNDPGIRPPIYDEHTSFALNANKGYRRGYYGEYLYGVPDQVYLRVLNNQGGSAAGVTVKLYQRSFGPGLYGSVAGTIDNTPEITGITDANGRLLLTNRSVGTPVTTRTGHVLHDNPFGLINIVGSNDEFILAFTKGGHQEFHWLDITAFNLAFWRGGSTSATLDIVSHVPPSQAPSAPVNLTAIQEYGLVKLHWSVSPSSGVTSYNIYRTAGYTSAYQRIATGITALSYSDPYNDSSRAATYAITAVDSSGRESGFSNPFYSFRLLSPVGIVVDEQNHRIVLDPQNRYALLYQLSNGTFFDTRGSVDFHLEFSQYIARDSEGHLILSHPGDYYSSRHSIRVADKAANPLFEFGDQGSAVGQFQTPAGVAVWGQTCGIQQGPYSVDAHTLLLLHFDNSYGGAQGETGTPNGASFTSGKYAQGVTMDSSDTLTYATAGNLNRTQGAIEFWIRPHWNGDDNQSYTFFEAGNVWFNRIRIMKDGANNLRFMLWDSTTEYGVAYNVANWRAGEWHHVAATWMGTDIALHVDGQQRENSHTANPPDTLANIMYVGSSSSVTEQSNADLDELRISDIPRVGNSDTCMYRILVADSGNNRLQAFDAQGNVIAAYGSFGSGASQFKNPQGVAVASNGNVIVADHGNNRLQVLSFNGSNFGFIRSITATLNAPTGVTTYGSNRILVADTGNNKVKVLDAQGNLIAEYTAPNDGRTGVFNQPRSVVVDKSGRIIVADTGNQRIVSILNALLVEVTSSKRADSDPTSAASVKFSVTFSEPVTGVNTAAPFSDFALYTNAVTGAAITGVSGSGATYIATVKTGSGTGTVRLDVVDDDSIKDGNDRPLGGPGAGNGDYTSGESYTINRPPNVGVYIGGELRGEYFLAANESIRQSFVGVNHGPVKITNTMTNPMIAAERVIYKANGGVNTSFSEMMGLPNGQLDKTYWLPWYNNVELDTQLRFANVTSQPAAVHVYIGGTELPGSPFTLAAGASTRKSFAGINNGPVKIQSDFPVVASERVIYKASGGVNTSFSEMMALPNSQLDTMYWLPWYNNVDIDTQLRFANVSSQPATVHVYIGNTEMTGSPFSLAPGVSTRKSFPGVNNGPVKIQSNVNIVAAERVIYKAAGGINTSFSEMMALPNSQIGKIYWLPWYNNVDLDTQLRFANVVNQQATVHVYIGGHEPPGSPFTLAAGASMRKSFVGVNAGPIKVMSDQNIVAAERVIYKTAGNVNTSFSEMMGLPATLLNSTYWLPWYNNVDLDTQLRFGVP